MTKPATLDEVAKMVQGSRPDRASLKIGFYNGAGGEVVQTVQLKGQFLRFPSATNLPDLAPPSPRGFADLGHLMYTTNADYYRTAATCCHHSVNFRPIVLAIANCGEVLAEDFRLELTLPSNGGLEVLREYELIKEMPRKRENSLLPRRGLRIRRVASPRRDGAVEVSREGGTFKLEVEFHKIQPGRCVCSEKLFVAAPGSGPITASGRAFSRNLPVPWTWSPLLEFDMEVQEVDRQRFLKWADNPSEQVEE